MNDILDDSKRQMKQRRSDRLNMQTVW